MIKQLITTCKQIFQFSLSNSIKLKQQFKELEDKDILTLDEAAFYLSKDSGTILEEVGLGNLPGGKLDGQWHFSKSALSKHFSIYHKDELGWFDNDEDFYESSSDFCDFEAVKDLLKIYSRGERNFSEINLSKAFMSCLNIPYINFSKSILTAIDLQGSNLQGANFEFAQLEKANLSHANLKGANLINANLKSAILFGAELEGASLNGANLSGANVQNTILS